MRADPPTTRILMFHRVLENEPAAFGLPSCYRMRGTALTVAELIEAIDHAAPIIPLADVERALADGEAPPPGSVLTFDDGYREHLDLVAPLLADRGLTATFYVASGLHGDGRLVAPVDAWYWLLDHAVERLACVPLPAGGHFSSRIDDPVGKREWVSGEPKAAFLGASSAQQEVMLEALADSVGTTLRSDLPARLYLRPREWWGLRELGMRVGAHSVYHPRLTQVDDAVLEHEVSQSVDALRSGATPVAFAYPDGAFNERVIQAVRRSGVSSAVTCEAGEVGRGGDLLRLPRVFVKPYDERSAKRSAP